MPRDPEELAHLEWLGYVQPVGLVVSIPALLGAQAHVQRNIAAEHQRFLACLPRDKQDEVIPEIRDFPEFTRTVFGWEASDLIGTPGGEPVPATLEAVLPGYNETLRPTFAVREFEKKLSVASRQLPATGTGNSHRTGNSELATDNYLLLIKSIPIGQDLDALADDAGSHWQATPHAKFERLLRETQVPIGLLVNGTQLRLVYAPRGETSGYATFAIADMAKVAGRPIFAALHMLLCAERLFSLPEKQRLPAILADSRKYQNVVSTQLAEQVLAALYELVRGLQAADEQRRGELLREVLAEDPNHVYAGLLTVLLRLVFILYAEDRGLLSSDPVYSNFYSVTGLFERLRADAGRYPDTMDQRYGAWAQLLTLFRLIYDGGRHGGLKIPARRGYLFDPDRYNFLEGRPWNSARRHSDKVDVPRVSDGVIYRVLEKLLILDGERLSYRTLDVEQIGSVYETIMGFNLEVAQGRSIAIKPTKPHGAPAAINLDELLAAKPADRGKWLAEKSDQKLTGQAAEALKGATSIEGMLAALERKIAHHATPNVVPKGAMVLQPSDERRKSGSHYTPRSLTEPIVRTTLKPILEQLGENPKPEQILALNVCDPAMGSGAFLVEVCRQLGDALVEAWHIHGCVPALPPDEDEVLHGRRLIAQQCLYGVDKNPLAVDLSKLSLWLATLAKDHPFTFLDHSLRCGDSLVGLSREQIAAFHWHPPAKRSREDVWFGDPIAERMNAVTEYRQRILASREDRPYEQLRQELDYADEQLSLARLAGDCVIAAFFSAEKDRDRVMKLGELSRQMVKYMGRDGKIEDRQSLTQAVAKLHSGERPVQPFHWEIEFPEVFTVDVKGKPTGGFDTIVENPPFLGGKRTSTVYGDAYFDFLMMITPDAHGNADLVAFFFRRAFELIRRRGTLGLIATQTISKGDTRTTGLTFICQHGGHIFFARRRIAWPGEASVIVSIVHIARELDIAVAILDGKPVPRITAFLFHRGGDANPNILVANAGRSFLGFKLYGQGFLFSDDDTDATPIAEMRRLIEKSPENQQVIRPYLGGSDLNSSPTQSPHRFVVDFGAMSEEKARQWPDVMSIVEAKVKPERIGLKRKALVERWWQYGEKQPGLVKALAALDRALVVARVAHWIAFAFVPANQILNEKIVVFPIQGWAPFAVMSSRTHDVWVRLFSSSLKDDVNYAATDCFETFPFPAGVLEREASDSAGTNPPAIMALEMHGREYYEIRAAWMVDNNVGLTRLYNRFHDPNETSSHIATLRELHAAMDRAVLEAYGWHDLAETATCEFLLDYEDDEEDEEETSGRRRKKPWRYRWPDDFRDEVLARLLDLNQKRAEEERLAGKAADARSHSDPKGGRRRRAAAASQTDLFRTESSESGG